MNAKEVPDALEVVHIERNSRGWDFSRLLGLWLRNVTSVEVHEPYLRERWQREVLAHLLAELLRRRIPEVRVVTMLQHDDQAVEDDTDTVAALESIACNFAHAGLHVQFDWAQFHKRQLILHRWRAKSIRMWLDRGLHFWRKPYCEAARASLAACRTLERSILIEPEDGSLDVPPRASRVTSSLRMLPAQRLRRLLHEIQVLRCRRFRGDALRPAQLAKLSREDGLRSLLASQRRYDAPAQALIHSDWLCGNPLCAALNDGIREACRLPNCRRAAPALRTPEWQRIWRRNLQKRWQWSARIVQCHWRAWLRLRRGVNQALCLRCGLRRGFREQQSWRLRPHATQVSAAHDGVISADPQGHTGLLLPRINVDLAVEEAPRSSVHNSAPGAVSRLPDFAVHRMASCSFEFRHFFAHFWSSRSQRCPWTSACELRLLVVLFWWRRRHSWHQRASRPPAFAKATSSNEVQWDRSSIDGEAAESEAPCAPALDTEAAEIGTFQSHAAATPPCMPVVRTNESASPKAIAVAVAGDMSASRYSTAHGKVACSAEDVCVDVSLALRQPALPVDDHAQVPGLLRGIEELGGVPSFAASSASAIGGPSSEPEPASELPLGLELPTDIADLGRRVASSNNGHVDDRAAANDTGIFNSGVSAILGPLASSTAATATINEDPELSFSSRTHLVMEGRDVRLCFRCSLNLSADLQSSLVWTHLDGGEGSDGIVRRRRVRSQCAQCLGTPDGLFLHEQSGDIDIVPVMPDRAAPRQLPVVFNEPPTQGMAASESDGWRDEMIARIRKRHIGRQTEFH